MIDLHIHTTRSDGQFSPEETMRLAHQNGVTTVAVTDHDAVSGIPEAQQTACAFGMTFFSGIEISVQGEKELHILGYGVDPQNEELLRFCRKNAEDRKKRTQKMLVYLASCGVPVTLEEVRHINQGRTSGRPHFARTLMAKGYVSSVQEAFEKYLATPRFYAEVERPKPTPEAGIHVLRNAGGVAVLAHPHQLQLDDEAMERLLQQLKGYGLQGIEAYYSLHTAEQTKKYLVMAQKYQLLYTCGSDFHGPDIKPRIALGTGIERNLCIPDQPICKNLEEAIAARRTY